MINQNQESIIFFEGFILYDASRKAPLLLVYSRVLQARELFMKIVIFLRFYSHFIHDVIRKVSYPPLKLLVSWLSRTEAVYQNHCAIKYAKLYAVIIHEIPSYITTESIIISLFIMKIT